MEAGVAVGRLMVVKEWFGKSQNDERGMRKNEMPCVRRRKQQGAEIRIVAVLKRKRWALTCVMSIS